MNIRYRVKLTDVDRQELLGVVGRGREGARRVKRAQILLAADKGLLDKTIVAACNTSTSTVYRTKRHYVEHGLEPALSEKPRRGRRRKTTIVQEAMLTAIACADPPPGRRRWTLELLSGELVRLTDLKSVSRDTIRRRLKESDLKPWREKMWCVPKLDAEFVARMEDILDLYAEPRNALRPVVCFDEKPVQLLSDARPALPAEPGRLRRYDYEYRRQGTANLFVFLDAKKPWRHVRVTERRTKKDFAVCMKELADVHYPEAELIRVVLDNLSTHRAAALYETFSPAEARRMLRRLEFHYTPKHGSWLNMVEVENGVIGTQCLRRRVPDVDSLASALAIWERQRNAAGATVRWRFTVDDARQKMPRAYPTVSVATSATED